MGQKYRMFVLTAALMASTGAQLVSVGQSWAESVKIQEIPIYPTWQLMDDDAKRQFLAGYIFGHREARALGEVVVEYLRQNPQADPDDVAGVLEHYRLTSMTSNQLVPLIDQYLKNPEHQKQSLRAIINHLNR